MAIKKTLKKKASTKKSVAEKINIANLIFDLYSNNNFTIESCCGEHGITYRTLINWQGVVSEISQGFKKAKDHHSRLTKEKCRVKALDGLQQMLEGHMIVEVTEEKMIDKMGNIKGKKIIKKQKWITPNPTAIIFALKNTDPANWNDTIDLNVDQTRQIFKIGKNVIEFN